MPLRPPAGFIRPGFDPLKNPNAPTIGTATGGDQSASVSFTPPANVGGSAISAYYAVSNPDRVTVSGATSPISVTGLTNGTPYTFQVWALNTYGPGPFSAASGSVTPNPIIPTAIFAGGSVSGVKTNVIQSVVFSTLGNTSDFGDLIVATDTNGGGCGSSTRGLYGGGNTASGRTNVIQYITFSSASNAIDFGDLAVAFDSHSALSNSTRGVFVAGDTGAITNIMEYVTIASTGNATDFGDRTIESRTCSAAASTTRGLTAQGFVSSGSGSNQIDYITIATTGNATTFGNLTNQTYNGTACSNSTRAIFAGGTQTPDFVSINVMDYVTIASTGNALDFGDLLTARRGLGGSASSTRGLFAGGGSNVIQYVTIASTGNAIDFGDLLQVVEAANLFAGFSNAHGGL